MNTCTKSKVKALQSKPKHQILPWCNLILRKTFKLPGMCTLRESRKPDSNKVITNTKTSHKRVMLRLNSVSCLLLIYRQRYLSNGFGIIGIVHKTTFLLTVCKKYCRVSFVASILSHKSRLDRDSINSKPIWFQFNAGPWACIDKLINQY